ncbi:MAG: MerR family transcriptional regulator, light-induced transcriptional regulator [Solirubrobacteraceae bacterium]|jgi:DNA-binding transcriptional MerR regulator|nr:MerR family transcriptional regulator, light-induced transcriptional regulator [Solirubrobacteraceae bacterium]
MERVVIGGHTVSATRFAEMTGVSRERLRTWERRFGFPAPVRIARGPRRYAIDDVQRVVAVRRAAASGVPLARAIASAQPEERADPVVPDTFAALVERAPLPVVALSGPIPLRLEYANAVVRALPGAPRAGEELVAALPAFHGSPCLRTLQRLFATDAGPTEAEHPGWDGHPRHAARSAVFRLPSAPGARPLVAMVGLEGEGERVARARLAERERELAAMRAHDERHTRWLDAIAGLAQEFRLEPTSAAIDNSLDVLVRQTNAVDGAVALYVSGRLVLPGSRRGILRAAPITVAAHPGIARCLRDAAPTWLDPAASSALGVPPDLHASATPIIVAGEPLGILLFVFNEVEPHDDDNRRLLAAVSAAMGFGLLRDRLAQELREAAGAPW